MKSFKRRTLSIFLILFMLVKPTFTQAMESEESFNETDDKVEQLFDQRTQMLLQGEYDEVENIDNQLEALGIHKMSEQEVEDFMDSHYDTDISPYVEKPTNGKLIWFSAREKETFRGVEYEVQTLHAVPTDEESSLRHANSGNAAVLNSTSPLQAAALNLVKTFAVGRLEQLVPGLSTVITAYDILKPFYDALEPKSKVENLEISYTYVWTASVTFKYVKKADQSDDYQAMTFASSKCSVKVAWNIPMFKIDEFGIASPEIIQGNRDLSGIAVGYNSNDRAIRAYLDPTEPRDSFIHYITVKDPEDKTAFVIWLPTPSSPLLLLND